MKQGPAALNSMNIRQRQRSLDAASNTAKKKPQPPLTSAVSNLASIRARSAARILPVGDSYKPQKSECFLENWLDFPVNDKRNEVFYSIRLWLVWLLWTNKGMAGLDPSDPTIRSRIGAQLTVLGSAAGLFLVIAVAGFLQPPEAKTDNEKLLVDIFGCLMFGSTVSFVYYIGFSLTAYYPLMESMRDDLAFDAFYQYQYIMSRTDFPVYHEQGAKQHPQRRRKRGEPCVQCNARGSEV